MIAHYSIGVVTYLGRFETYFKPLIRKLYFLFPDYDIIVFINGHYDTKKQISYLKNVTSFLRNYPSIRYVTNLEHQPLARGWNWLVMMAEGDKVLILNDDIIFKWDFRYYLEQLDQIPEIFTLNKVWSHFVVNKDIIRKVGWFDERFPGTAYEDTDYEIRLALKGVTMEDRIIHALGSRRDSQSVPEDPSWGNISEILGQHSKINWEFFQKKWGVRDRKEELAEATITVRAVGAQWRLNPDAALQTVPEFYPLDVLDRTIRRKPGIEARLRGQVARLLSRLNGGYWRARLTVGAWLFRIMKARREQLPRGQSR